MAVSEVKRRRTTKGKFGTSYRNEYTVDFYVNCDSIMQPAIVYSEGQVAAVDQLPAIYDYYDYDGFLDTSAYCLDVDLQMRDDSGLRWYATATYGRLPANTTPNDQPPNPLDKPNRERLEWIESTEAIEKDRNDAPIVNTLGDPFDTAIEEPVLYPVLVVEKVYATLQEIIDLGLQYHRTANSVTFRGGAPRTVKLLPIQASDIQYEANVSYYTATLRFAYNPKTWDRVIMNRGWRYRPAVGQDPIQAIDKKTRLPVTTPVKLAADGTLLAEAAAPHFISFQTLELEDYNLIPGI